MWWLLSLVPVLLLPFVDCLADRKPAASQPAIQMEESTTDESSKTRKSSLSQKKDKTKTAKRVSFKDEVLARQQMPQQPPPLPSQPQPQKKSISSSVKADAAIRADQKAAEMARQLAAPSPLPPLPADAIHLEPAEILTAACGGLYAFNLVNKSAEALAYKVKCSDNDLYRVRPVFGLVGAKSSSRIDILRQNGPLKQDKLVVVATRAVSTDARSSLAGVSRAQTTMAAVALLVEE